MDPYRIIDDFFSALSIENYRKYILSMLKAAGSASCWHKQDPGSLLYVQQKLVDLLATVHFMAKMSENRVPVASNTILSPHLIEGETIDPAHYMTRQPGNTQWVMFPRHLSGREFLDPIRTFRRFFAHKSLKTWQKDLKELVFYALSPHSCSEDLMDLDLLGIYISLEKLVESAHLIWIRQIIPASDKI